jgi:ubiquinone biosynthesis protein COQ9
MKENIKEKLITSALRQIPFEGWTKTAFEKSERAAGMNAGTYAAHFPGGVQEFIRSFHQWVDDAMTKKITAQHDFNDAKIRDKIFRCVMARIETLNPHREAMRRLVGHQLLPWNKPFGARDVACAADAMWKLAGDKSIDYNFYTKRFLLSGVYASTLNYWFSDDSENYADTQNFLRNRIDDVLKFGKFVAKFKKKAA